MLEATKSTLRTGRPLPHQVIARQLKALDEAGYRLRPPLPDNGAALLLATTKRTFRSGKFRPADVIDRQLAELAARGHTFQRSNGIESLTCGEFQWGPGSFDSCQRCGLSFWQHDESDALDG